MRCYILAPLSIVAALVWFACERESATTSRAELAMTDTEAEEAAIVLSRELVAPRSLYERLHTDLTSIRRLYGDSIPAVNIRFRLPWALGEIVAKVDTAQVFDSTTDAFRTFDSLDSVYRLKPIEHLFDSWYILAFEGSYNPVRLVEIYAAVEGMLTMQPNAYVGDGPSVLIYPEGAEFKYFFRDAWGECRFDCPFEELFYVSSLGGGYTFHGSYYIGFDTLAAPPSWLDTVWMARDMVFYSIVWRPDSVKYWP